MSGRATRDWRFGGIVDLGVRVVGLAAALVAALSFHALARLHGADPHADSTAMQYVLAGLGCIGASGGGALLILGHHIFDEVIISERWARAAQDTADRD